MNPKTTFSPKVIAAAIVGFIVTALTGAVATLNPDAYDALGPWGPLAQAAVSAGAMALAGWWKTDPLRVVPHPDAVVVPGQVVEFGNPLPEATDAPEPLKADEPYKWTGTEEPK